PHEKREAFDPPIDASGFGLGFCTALVPLSEAAAFFGSGFPPRRRVCAGAPATRSACEAGGWRRSHRNNCRAEVLGLVQSAMSLTWPWRSEPGPFLLATVPRFYSGCRSAATTSLIQSSASESQASPSSGFRARTARSRHSSACLRQRYR